ncbi:MAG: NifU family protein [Acidimicrobiaceae bacterium]|nr:NifU family protein [Acidimicrobiaceae bacterium]MCY4174817.1 NifU family protein [Acidimicrobiaceae bacterium]MCY4280425.1 NifU family protein [Acidimicrobiaceae bacterium]MCY4293631.1 NifU family protein [Acidimicrobiaceae bacterium]
MAEPAELAYGDILARAAELASSLLECGDARTSADAEELLDWLDAYHREGLGRLVEMVRQWRGELFLEQAALDPVVGDLLATYGLGTDTDAAAVDRVVQLALDEVRPYIHSHGGEVEVLSARDGVVSLRMHGNCNGCTASDDTVTRRIEAALREHWIDFRRVETEQHTAAPHPPPSPGQAQAATGLAIGPRPS